MACAFDARFISGVANNNPVDIWRDRTTNARNATQSNATKKPTYKTGELNGNPALSFDGGDCLTTVTFPASAASSAFVIFKASANGLVYERGTFFNVAGDSYIYTTTGDTSLFNGASLSAFNRSTNWGLGSVWRFVSHENNGTHATHQFFIDGAAQTMTAAYTNNPGSSNYTLGVNIGARNDAASLGLTGAIASYAFGPFLQSPARKRLQSSWALSFKIACS
jgi:hypothetical protein